LTNVPANTTVGCSGTIPTSTTPTVTDNCDKNPKIEVKDSRRNGLCAGSYVVVRTWTATDSCGNTATASQEISVGDTEGPIFANIPANITVGCDKLPTFTDPTISDKCDSLPTLTVKEKVIPGSCGGSYELIRTWTAIDGCGNTNTAEQRIKVGDTESPKLTNVPANVTVGCSGTIPTSTTPTVTDNCDKNPKIEVKDSRRNGTCAGSYVVVRTWTATDSCGNTATAAQEISVGDTEGPIFANIPANITVGCDKLPTFTDPTISDKCDSLPTLTVKEKVIPGSCGGSYELIRTWTATDGCGNSNTAEPK
jgi:large repetitive protein